MSFRPLQVRRGLVQKNNLSKDNKSFRPLQVRRGLVQSKRKKNKNLSVSDLYKFVEV